MISSNKKVILYAPTFSRKMTSVPKILKILKQLPRENELFVIKLHDLHDKQEREILKSLSKEKFLFVDSPDIIPWMQSSDMLISDTSSVVYEYALIKDKILLVEPKRKELPFTQCSVSNIRKAIDDVLYSPCQNREEIRKEMNAVHPYRDGLCAQRIFDTITDPDFIKHANALPRKRNIFRKLKLRYYDRFKKGYVK
jgi:UDP-N-acetylglucosamine 2-epimerase